MNNENGQERVAPPSRKLQQWLQFVPNSLTLCNSLCGYAAILVTLQAYKHSSLQIACLLSITLTAGRKRIIIECAWK